MKRYPSPSLNQVNTALLPVTPLRPLGRTRCRFTKTKCNSAINGLVWWRWDNEQMAKMVCLSDTAHRCCGVLLELFRSRITLQVPRCRARGTARLLPRAKSGGHSSIRAQHRRMLESTVRELSARLSIAILIFSSRHGHWSPRRAAM